MIGVQHSTPEMQTLKGHENKKHHTRACAAMKKHETHECQSQCQAESRSRVLMRPADHVSLPHGPHTSPLLLSSKQKVLMRPDLFLAGEKDETRGVQKDLAVKESRQVCGVACQYRGSRRGPC
jgi:hypothetical protein